MNRMSGIITPLVMPFNDDGSVDSESLASLVRFQVENGIHGLFLFGSSGEGPALTESQRIRALKVVSDAVGAARPVLVGVGDNSTARVIERAKQAAEFGASGLVVTAPFYHVNSQCEIMEHFASVRAAVDLPVYAYDVPVLVKARIEPSTVMKLARDNTIAGVKDSSGDMSGLRQIILGTRDIGGFSVFTGMELLVDAAVLMGASGAVAGLANVAPREYVELYNACTLGEWEQAVEIQNRLTRLFEIVYVGVSGGGFASGALSAFKAALVCRGILANCNMAAPMKSLDQDGVDRVSRILRRLEFTEA